ncbi:MAG: GntR family transcriptional regulator [Mycobacterium sp.]
MARLSDNPSASDEVAKQLRREILNGDMQPGDRLREEDLSARFQRSRYTIRAAIKILTDARLLEHERNRGAIVPRLTRSRVDEVFGYRSALELGSLRIALQHNADFSRAERAFDKMASLPPDVEWQELTEAHGRIHAEIVAASANSRLISAHAGCLDELRLLIVVLRPNFALDRFVELHRTMLDGLQVGGDTAFEALRIDLEGDGYRAILAALHQQKVDARDGWRD